MTLEQIILYPLTHRVVTESWYAINAQRLDALINALPTPPVKAKRAYVRKAKV